MCTKSNPEISHGFKPFSESYPPYGKKVIVQVDYYEDKTEECYQSCFMYLKVGKDGKFTDMKGHEADLNEYPWWDEKPRIGYPVAWKSVNGVKGKDIDRMIDDSIRQTNYNKGMCSIGLTSEERHNIEEYFPETIY